jgi:hypothetical protein
LQIKLPQINLIFNLKRSYTCDKKLMLFFTCSYKGIPKRNEIKISLPANWLITQWTLPTGKTVACIREVSTITVETTGHRGTLVTIRTGPSGFTTVKHCCFRFGTVSACRYKQKQKESKESTPACIFAGGLRRKFFLKSSVTNCECNF